MQYPESSSDLPDDATAFRPASGDASTQHSAADELRELYSAAFDGEVSGELVPGANTSPTEEQQQLQSQWTQLSGLLQQLPQQPVDLVSAIREQRSATMEVSAQRDATVVVSGRSDARRNPRWVALTTCLAALAVLAVLPWLTGRNPVNDVVATALVDVMTHYGDPDSWNVVVIDVADSQAAERTVQRMLGTAAQRGAGVARLGASGETNTEFSAGMLVTAGAETQSVLESLSAESMEADWNPSVVGRHSSQEIKQMFVQAMQVPTRSDLVFGAMYVVDDTGRHVTLAQLPPADNMSSTEVAVVETSQPAVAGEGESADVEESDAAPASAARPLIVIFRRVDGQPPAKGEEQGCRTDLVTGERTT